MQQSSICCIQNDHNNQEIEYICKHPQCKSFRYLCKKCILESTHYHDQEDNSHIGQKKEYEEQQQSQIKHSRYKIMEISNAYDNEISIAAISNDLKYIISSARSPILNIWDYQTGNLIKSIKFKYTVDCCKFTEDSRLLYVGTVRNIRIIYQLQVYNQFKQIATRNQHKQFLSNIYCISNNMLLSSSYDGTIIKTYFSQNKQIFRIRAHRRFQQILGLDFNKRNNVIASGSSDRSIKLWNGNNGSLIIQKQNAHNNLYEIIKVLFIIDSDQLISLDSNNYILIWNINYNTKQLVNHKIIINDKCDISLVLDQQYLLITTHSYYMKVYNLKYELIKEYYLGDFPLRMIIIQYLGYLKTSQLNSMKAILFLAEINELSHLFVCKINLN